MSEKHKYPNVGYVVRTKRISGRRSRNVPYFPLEKEQHSARTGSAKIVVFFRRKICNAKVGFMVIRIKQTSVVSKQNSERTSRRTNVGFKQQEPFLRTLRKCQGSSNQFSKYSFSTFFCFDFGQCVDTCFENSYGRDLSFFGTLLGL